MSCHLTVDANPRNIVSLSAARYITNSPTVLVFSPVLQACGAEVTILIWKKRENWREGAAIFKQLFFSSSYNFESDWPQIFSKKEKIKKRRKVE